MGFTGNNRGIRYVLLALIVVFALGALGYCSTSRADEAQGLSIGFGAGLSGSEPCFGAMMLGQELADGKWIATLATHGDSSSCRATGEPVDANMGAGIVRTTQLGRFTIGFGAGLWQHGDISVGPSALYGMVPPRRDDAMQLCANILLRVRVTNRVVADLLHCSTGGSTAFNRGRNIITFGVRL